MLSRASAFAAATATTAAKRTPARSLVSHSRAFSSEPRRAKAVKVKKNDARRRVEPKPEQPNALVEAPDAPPPSPFVDQQPPQTPMTFGQVLKHNFVFGVGMALAFSIIGAIASSMEETPEPGMFGASDVIVAASDEDNVAAAALAKEQ
ncbi:hypothetical protein PybrP1_013056 [[Pythium] brassicae (nom. inval.)]|nr:hypothetical protein PybrP1_013056 [[Pythium] brassicae (nom. inval.)]